MIELQVEGVLEAQCVLKEREWDRSGLWRQGGVCPGGAHINLGSGVRSGLLNHLRELIELHTEDALEDQCAFKRRDWGHSGLRKQGGACPGGAHTNLGSNEKFGLLNHLCKLIEPHVEGVLEDSDQGALKGREWYRSGLRRQGGACRWGAHVNLGSSEKSGSLNHLCQRGATGGDEGCPEIRGEWWSLAFRLGYSVKHNRSLNSMATLQITELDRETEEATEKIKLGCLRAWYPGADDDGRRSGTRSKKTIPHR
jgi:hypothetical protein